MVKTRRTVLSTCLRQVREYVQRGWVQGVSAKNAKGRACMPTSKTATCWCITGAMTAASVELPSSYRGILVSQAEGAIGSAAHLKDNYGFDLISWNDRKGRTQEQILNVLDRAIRTEERV